jgi:hypothetical protein
MKPLTTNMKLLFLIILFGCPLISAGEKEDRYLLEKYVDDIGSKGFEWRSLGGGLYRIEHASPKFIPHHVMMIEGKVIPLDRHFGGRSIRSIFSNGEGESWALFQEFYAGASILTGWVIIDKGELVRPKYRFKGISSRSVAIHKYDSDKRVVTIVAGDMLLEIPAEASVEAVTRIFKAADFSIHVVEN